MIAKKVARTTNRIFITRPEKKGKGDRQNQKKHR